MYIKIVLIVAGFSFLFGCATNGSLQQRDVTSVKKINSTEPVNLDNKQDVTNTEEITNSKDFTDEKYLLADSGQQLSQEETGCNTIALCVSFIKQEILKNWSPQSNYKLMKTNIAFVIGDNYELSKIKVVKSSGNALFDSSVLAAVSASSPFSELGELPESEFERIREINLVFSPPPKKKKAKKKKTVLSTLNVRR